MKTNDFELSTKTLAEQVQDRIREAILNQVLRPGKRIDQNRLAEELKVSLVPVRTALKGLEAEGLVSIVPRRGAFVTEISLQHLDDLYAARQIIEGELVFQAVPCLTEGHFIQLHELINKMKQATDARDIQTFMRLNRDFHLIIYQSLNNQHLMETVLRLWERSELYRYRYMFVLNNADKVHADHLALLEACRMRDAQRAKEIAILHIQHTQDGLHRELETELQRGK